MIRLNEVFLPIDQFGFTRRLVSKDKGNNSFRFGNIILNSIVRKIEALEKKFGNKNDILSS